MPSVTTQRSHPRVTVEKLGVQNQARSYLRYNYAPSSTLGRKALEHSVMPSAPNMNRGTRPAKFLLVFMLSLSACRRGCSCPKIYSCPLTLVNPASTRTMLRDFHRVWCSSTNLLEHHPHRHAHSPWCHQSTPIFADLGCSLVWASHRHRHRHRRHPCAQWQQNDRGRYLHQEARRRQTARTQPRARTLCHALQQRPRVSTPQVLTV